MKTPPLIDIGIRESDRKGIAPVVEKAADEASADLLTQRIQLHEKTAWMLRSLLEE